MPNKIITEFLKILTEKLQSANWGTIDPYWFKPGYADPHRQRRTTLGTRPPKHPRRNPTRTNPPLPQHCIHSRPSSHPNHLLQQSQLQCRTRPPPHHPSPNLPHTSRRTPTLPHRHTRNHQRHPRHHKTPTNPNQIRENPKYRQTHHDRLQTQTITPEKTHDKLPPRRMRIRRWMETPHHHRTHQLMHWPQQRRYPRPRTRPPTPQTNPPNRSRRTHKTMTDKPPTEMPFDEFLEWATAHIWWNIPQGKPLKQLLWLILNQAAQNKIWGGRKPNPPK